MEIIIYRHAEPLVTGNEIIFGHDFPLWVLRYNESGIVKIAPKGKKKKTQIACCYGLIKHWAKQLDFA